MRPLGAANRFLSIVGAETKYKELIRVVAVSLLPPFDGWNQTKWFLTAPFQVCENSGQGLDVTPPNCAAAPGQSQKWFWAAELACDSIHAHLQDWSELSDYCSGPGESCLTDSDCAFGTCGVDGVVHILDPAMIPRRRNAADSTVKDSVFVVQALNFTWAPAAGSCYSKPVTRAVQSVWGDIAGAPGDCPVAAPDGTASLIGDVTEAIRKFANLECAAKKTRVDVQPADVDFRIDFTDVLLLLDAFAGEPYPFTPEDQCGF